MSDTVHISADAGPDLAAIINAALADPTVTTVVLGAGTFLLDSPIIVPTGKTLTGSGRAATIIRASADFTIPSAQQNAVIVSEEQSSNITLSDFTVDAAKISPDGLRLNGIFMRFSADFDIARIDVMNTTGYAHYAAGDLGAYLSGGQLGTPASGTYQDCNTYNAQVHFEQFYADGITLTNVHARDGDGDIPTEAYFHPLVGSRNITYENSSAIGSGFLGFSLISSVLPLENIQIINTEIEIMPPSQGSALISLGGLPVNGLHIEDSSFIAHEYIAFRIGGVTGTAANSYFQGGLFALEVTTSGDGTPSDFDVTDSHALGVRDANSGIGVAGVHSDQASYLSWTGGTIEARAGLMFPVSGAVTVSPTTQLISDGHDIVSSYTEGGSDLALFASKDFGVAGTANLDGATIRADYLSFETTTDRLFLAQSGGITISGSILRYNGTVVGSIAGGANGTALVITLNAAATSSIAEVLLDKIYFRSTSGGYETTTRMMVAGLQLAGGAYQEITASLTVIGVADNPATAVADNGATTESAAVLLDALANDTDPDERLDTIAEIDDIAIAPGGTVLLASGAQVMLTNDGKLLYDPNGAFDDLVAAGSGAANTTATDSFTYTLSGGSSAMVEITISGEASAGDIIIGDENANTLNASVSGQLLIGQGGADILRDNGFAVTLKGQTDNDIYVVGNATTLVIEAAGSGTDEVRTTLGTYTLGANIENVTFTATSGRFTSYGNALANVMTGGAEGDFLISYSGADVLRGGAGADVLDGGADHDILDGGTGNDVMIGGAGNDVFYVESAGDVVIEGGDPGFDTIFTTLSSYTLAAWVENLSFSGTGSFTGTGNFVGNQMQGSAWNDILDGVGGNDRLIGFGGNDALDGGEGDDLLQGGVGSDMLTGGTGADQFRFDTTLAFGDVDLISDFESGVDQIQLSRAVFSALGLGTLSADAFANGASVLTASHRIIYEAETGSLYYDPDGSGAQAAVKFASVAPNSLLVASDFLII
jgi:Ca2+-binding RTX toxin-like protein